MICSSNIMIRYWPTKLLRTLACVNSIILPSFSITPPKNYTCFHFLDWMDDDERWTKNVRITTKNLTKTERKLCLFRHLLPDTGFFDQVNGNAGSVGSGLRASVRLSYIMAIIHNRYLPELSTWAKNANAYKMVSSICSMFHFTHLPYFSIFVIGSSLILLSTINNKNSTRRKCVRQFITLLTH